MFRIKQIDHLVLRVTDIEAMLEFYVDLLGCELEKVQQGIGLYQLRAGASLIDLVPVDGKLGKMGGAAMDQDGQGRVVEDLAVVHGRRIPAQPRRP